MWQENVSEKEDIFEYLERRGKGEEVQQGGDICIRTADSGRRAWQPTPVFLPGESHGQRSLAGYSLWGHKESATTEVTQHAYMHS